jgi:ATP-dependent Clp protease ATP-binding subunit ClpC
MLDEVVARTQKQMGIEMHYDHHAVQYLLEKGTDKIYGARPLRRAIQTNLEDAMADEILKGAIKEGDTVTVTTRKKQLYFRVR